MNRQAVRIANEIAAEGGALVAGNICNTWAYDPSEPEASGAVVRAQYEEQLGWAARRASTSSSPRPTTTWARR